MGDANARESLIGADSDVHDIVATLGAKVLCLQRLLTYRTMAGHVGVDGAYRQREGASMTWGSLLFLKSAFLIPWSPCH